MRPDPDPSKLGRSLGALCPRRRRALGPAAGRPPAPPGRLRRHLGRDPARPEGRPRSVDRPAAGREVPILRRPRGFRRVRRPPGRPGAGRARAQSPQGLVGLPHALRPGPADRAADPDVARPLRHQQPQGQRPGADAAAERDPALALPRPVRPAAARDAPRPGPARSGSTRRRTPRGTPTRTWPAS